MSGTLFCVATPIGNLEDITLRALRVLKEADLIAAEDTRRTRKLLTHYSIKTPLTSYFEHNEEKKGPQLIKRLEAGQDVALVSDAGTPGVSDPGFRLIRRAIVHSITVTAVPGPSALLAVLSISGLPLDTFTFKGFVPRTEGPRRRFIAGLRGAAGTIVVYETPGRLNKTLVDIGRILGLETSVVVAREMTKLHEEVVRGTVAEVMEALKGRTLKGEVTVVVSPPTEVKPSTRDIGAELKALVKDGFSLKHSVRIVADEMGLPKRDVYKEALKIK